MQKSSKLSNNEVVALCTHAIDYIEEILEYFDVTYRISGNRILAACPIHEGDNKTALNLYVDNDVPGMWLCNTHHCEQQYWKNLIGFVHALICKTNQDQDINNTIKWLMEFTGFNDVVATKFRTVSTTPWQTPKKQQDVCNLTRQGVIKSLLIPSNYYIKRKYSTYILQKYDVGVSNKHHRTFFPIYNDEYTKIVGFVSRSLYEKCEKCSGYHRPNTKCPDHLGKHYIKWANSPTNFPKTQYLFNHWFAKPYIQKTNTAILVEGPGDVLRLEDNNIHNSVAVFGTTLSVQQKEMLEKDGVMNLVVLFDNDNAGKAAQENLKKELGRSFRLIFPQLVGNDIGDGNPRDIEMIKAVINE
jgi:5S rRNA maturation endonuclease (ribonuclease M5)